MLWVEEDVSLRCSTSYPFSTRLKRKFGVRNRSVSLFRRKKNRVVIQDEGLLRKTQKEGKEFLFKDEGVSRKESKVVVTNYKSVMVNGKAIMVEADVDVGCKPDVKSRLSVRGLIAPANKDKQPFVSHTKAVEKVKSNVHRINV
uniref:Uncharacterized protein n=1 Tax=Tanacetum cinerariifolium TaxID=118510 RepID=A0A6L2L2I7_TANCI|nr:hypothetical protein [Tanacetum cinerariifolium]